MPGEREENEKSEAAAGKEQVWIKKLQKKMET